MNSVISYMSKVQSISHHNTFIMPVFVTENTNLLVAISMLPFYSIDVTLMRYPPYFPERHYNAEDPRDLELEVILRAHAICNFNATRMI